MHPFLTIFAILLVVFSCSFPRVKCQDYTKDYTGALRASLLFYEAQRTGHLPSTNRVSWRGDSMLYDQRLDGSDLTGGYFDAGDHVKFGFPMYYTITVLGWGLLDYAQGYKLAGEYENGIAALRWGIDYLLKAHPEANTLYAQVGDGVIDHKYWGRPEDFTGPRPSFKITKETPGSDLAGEASAAFSVSSLVFRETRDNYYADLCLRHAEELYNFANNYRGFYSNHTPGDYYKSHGYGDEVTWAATWLYRATKNESYLKNAKSNFEEFGIQYYSWFGWDVKNAGVQVLLAKLTGEKLYKDLTEKYCNQTAYEKPRTPKGLVFLSKWGSLRNIANAVFICMQAADIGINREANYALAREQIGYILGSTGRSFVVGFGVNPPTRPHHRSSSCPSPPASCDNRRHNPEPNPHILTGALVGGPDINDNYEDCRDDYMKNEVATDYNAAFQSALAGLAQAQANSRQ